ncbi:MAG: 5-formyltetrahydrofolate cyclo-ligase [Oscillospiraceae bacterium]|nr:5-formyltetrahydrofolate cyclo-ligase [Oscillospiraceae bacterium]
MTADQAIAYIENYTWSTTRLGLGRTKELLQKLGDPQKRLKFVHVAGSNGKGSTCAMLERILRAAGYRTGLYTSPYIQEFCERMRVNGENIPGEALARLTERVKAIADEMDDHPSQFELVTAIAMQYFLEAGCEIVVLEVGMGGALDSTNAIDAPEVAVITNLALEHTEYLGHTLSEIAATKGGIIKRGCSVVAYPNAPEVTAVLERICREQDAPLTWADFDAIRPVADSLDGQIFDYVNQAGLHIPLLGAHQLKNAAMALTVVDALRARGWKITEEAVRRGLASVKWPARFEVLHRSPLFLLDGGHNPQCAEALAGCVEKYLPGLKPVFLMGVLADKDFDAMLETVLRLGRKFICLTPENPRALSADALCEAIRAKGGEAEAAQDIPDGIRLALDTGAPVVAFGSLYLAGAIRTAFPRAIKQHQRKAAIAGREGLSPAARAEKSARIVEAVRALPAYKDANTVMLYSAVGAEVDLAALTADGKRFCYPLCTSKTEMEAYLPGAWKTGTFGIQEPDPAQSEWVPPSAIDLVLCPCAGFDGSGNRVGMGAGYYDRYLPQCKNAAVYAVAFEAQRLESVYTDEHDRTMDGVITEETI